MEPGKQTPPLNPPDTPIPPDAQVYIRCMEDLLPRFQLARSIFERRLTTGNDLLDVEIVFLELRKILEQIAFASLAANKDEYSRLRTQFATDWNATKMLKCLAQVNPRFYPEPFDLGPREMKGGRRHSLLLPLKDGFLTKDDFVELYDHCANIIHARNPYGNPVFKFGRTVPDWVSRVEKLVHRHVAHLITGGCWLITVPDLDGTVHAYTAEPLVE